MAVNNSPYLIVSATSSTIDREYDDDDDDDDDALELITETYNTCIDYQGYIACQLICLNIYYQLICLLSDHTYTLYSLPFDDDHILTCYISLIINTCIIGLCDKLQGIIDIIIIIIHDASR